jgi:hypothetical protein
MDKRPTKQDSGAGGMVPGVQAFKGYARPVACRLRRSALWPAGAGASRIIFVFMGSTGKRGAGGRPPEP